MQASPTDGVLMDLSLSDLSTADSSIPRVLYEKLRIGILVGELQTGQVLRQEELARRFNVSRVPLREALSQLEADGLIEARPRRGFAVTALDSEEIVEVFELRAVIEEHAGRVAARARTAQDISDVENLVQSMEALDPHSAEFGRRWTLLNYEFHNRIIASSRRKRLTRIAGILHSTIAPYVGIDVDWSGGVANAGREHREILEALRAGDADGLAELIRQHVEGTARRLLKSMRTRSLHNQPDSHDRERADNPEE